MHDDEVIARVNLGPFLALMVVAIGLLIVSARYRPVTAVPLDFRGESPGDLVQMTFTVDLDSRGISVEGKALSDDAFVVVAGRARSAIDTPILVIIHAANDVPYGRILKIIDRLLELGFTHFRLDAAVELVSPAFRRR